MCDDLLKTLAAAWNNLAHSEFFAALFGAVAGGIIAYLLGIRAQNKAALRTELQATRATLTLTNCILDLALNFKAQFITQMTEQYEAAFREYAASLQTYDDKKGIDIYIYAYLLALQIPPLAGKELQNLVIAGVTSSAAIEVAVKLNHCVETFKNLLAQRNALCSVLMQQDESLRLDNYFGLKHGSVTDQTYPNLLSGIFAQVDDIIYFADLLQEILANHGAGIAVQLAESKPVVTAYPGSKAEGLFPERGFYSDFEVLYRKSAPLPMPPPYTVHY